MSYGNRLLFEVQDNIGIVTLNNPAKLNCINQDFFDELNALHEELNTRFDIHALAIVANGEHFSSGFDLAFLKSMSAQRSAKLIAKYQRSYTNFQALPYPVVVGAQGICYGSAVEILLACDIRIAADNVRLSLLENRYGLAAAMGGTTRLTKLVGPGQAKRLLMSCDEVGANEALTIGLVEKVVPASEVREETIKYAKKLASFPTAGNRFIKMGVNLANEGSEASGLNFEVAVSNYSLGTDDFKEATAAFIEKRKPDFKGEYGDE